VNSPCELFDRARKLVVGMGFGELWSDDAGIATPIIVAIAGILGLLGISTAASINWKFLLATLVMVAIVLAVAGTVFFGVPFEQVIIVSILCLGIVTFIEVGVLAAAGLIVIGGAFYRVSPMKQVWVFVALIGFGLLTVILSKQFLIVELGMVP